MRRLEMSHMKCKVRIRSGRETLFIARRFLFGTGLVALLLLPGSAVAAFSVSSCPRFALESLPFSTRLYQSNLDNDDDNDSINNNNSNNNNNTPNDDPNDPRAYRRRNRILRDLNDANNFKKAKNKLQKRKRDEAKAAEAFDLPDQPLVRTIGGGTAMIFAMAQRMFEQQQSEEKTNGDNNKNNNDNSNKKGLGSELAVKFGSLPRWRPASGIANVNPSFRTSSPTMNNQGYAGVIWRNVRKRNKPSLWRYALRTYDRMSQLPEQATTTTNGGSNPFQSSDWQAGGGGFVVQPTNIHHEGALLAAAKLGLWQRALQIYRRVQDEEAALRKRRVSQLSVQVSEHMVNSVVWACVKASKQKGIQTTTDMATETTPPMRMQAIRREPLDAARGVLEELEARHGIPLDARHVNPLAAAYQAIGLQHEAARVVSDLLKDRVIGPEPEIGQETLNINDLGTKDKGSYALLVTGAVRDEDWGAAVENLKIMTEAGLYPVDRHLHVWTEVAERKTKHRTTRSWKKKRDESWMLRTVPTPAKYSTD